MSILSASNFVFKVQCKAYLAVIESSRYPGTLVGKQQEEHKIRSMYEFDAFKPLQVIEGLTEGFT